MKQSLIGIFEMTLTLMAGLGVIFWACFYYWFRCRGRKLMLETNHANEGNPGWSGTPPRAFPDLATCKVRRSEFGDCLDCLSGWSWHCPHALQIGNSYACRYPKILEILARKGSDPASGGRDRRP